MAGVPAGRARARRRRGRPASSPGSCARRATTTCCCSTSAAPAAARRCSAQTLARLGSAQAQADYLKHFRADSIVRDAEVIRRELTGGEPWALLGQSYGGFCVDDLPVDRARGRARGVHHRRAASARALRRRDLPRHVQAARRPEPPLLRALPGGRRAGARGSWSACSARRTCALRTARRSRRAGCSRSARSSA